MHSQLKTFTIAFTLRQFESALEDVKAREIRRFSKKMNEKELEMAEQVSSGMIQKIIALSAQQFKAAYQRGEGDKLCQVLQQLFELEMDSY